MKIPWTNGTTVGSLPAGIALLSLTPVLMIVLVWDFGNNLSPWREIVRYNSLVVPFLELLFVGLAINQGFLPGRSLRLLSPLTKSGLVILTACALWTTFFVAAVPFTAIMGIAKFIAHCLFALALSHLLGKWSQAARNIVWPAIGLGLLGYCFLWWINIVFYKPTGNDWVRLVPGSTNVRWVGFFAFACFCSAIGTLTVRPNQTRKHWPLLAALVFSTVAFTVAFWSGTRAAVVAMIVAAVFSALVLPVRRQIVLMIAISLILGLGITSILPEVHPIYGLDRIARDSSPAAGFNSVSSNRLQIWIEIFEKFLQRPMLGWGIDQLRYTYADQGNLVRNPHQAILQVLVSTGLCGLLAYLCIGARFVQSIPKKFTESYQFAAVAYVAGAVAYGLYDGFFYFTYPVMIFIVAAVCLVTPPHSSAVDKSG
jgi:O-Antigen ligase